MSNRIITRRVSLVSAAAALVASAAAPVLAQSKAAAAAPKTADLKRLSGVVETLMSAKVESIGASPVEGLFEVIVRGNVYYIDAKGEHIFDGHVVNVSSRSSITAQRKLDFERANSPVFEPAALNFDDAIKTVYGRATPGRVLVTFEDPRCGYCKKLHQDLAGAKDLVVYTFPVSFLGPQSRQLNEAIWCSEDRTKAWDTAMKGGLVAASGKTCDYGALDRNAELAQKYRVTGTPTMYTASGQRIVGAVGLETIEQAIKLASTN